MLSVPTAVIPALQRTLLYLALTLGLTACGGGSSGNTRPPEAAPPEASSRTSSSSSSDESSSASSASSLPTSVNGEPYCTPAGSDPDGDGWGWENDATCVVRNSDADPNRPDPLNGCVLDTTTWPFCTDETSSWGFEGGNICVAEPFCPANRPETQSALSTQLITDDPSPSAVAVYDYLRSVWGQKILSGQQDLTWKDDTDMYQRVVDDTGKAPAIMGYDYMNLGATQGSGLQQTEEALTHWQRGGLVAFTWHWRDPLTERNPEFYSDRTDFEIPIRDGQLDATSEAFAAINADIDRVAQELKTLRDADVAVLWRPLHEASGGWFWWGRARHDGVPPAYAQTLLWRHLYNRLTVEHDLNHLLWVWNGQGAAWYPGDAYVDITGRDLYTDPQDYSAQSDYYHEASAYSLQEKLVALTENGNIPDPDQLFIDGTNWLWFMVWNDGNSAAGETREDNFWTGEYYNTDAHKRHVYTHENVITLDELPSFTQP